MNAGDFNKRIELQSPTTDNNYGEITETWVKVADVWARIEPTGSSESIEGGMDGVIDYAVTIRYRAGVKSYHRFVWGDLILEIDGPPLDVIEDGSRVLQMACHIEEA